MNNINVSWYLYKHVFKKKSVGNLQRCGNTSKHLTPLPLMISFTHSARFATGPSDETSDFWSPNPPKKQHPETVAVARSNEPQKYKSFGTHSERKKPKSSCKILGMRVDTWLRLRIDDHLWLISSEKFAAQTASTPALCVPKSSKTLNQVMKNEQVTSQVGNTSLKKCPGSLPCQFWPSGPSQSSSMQWRGATELVSCIGISQGINQRLPNSRRAMRWSPGKGWWITQCFTRVHLGCFNAAPHCGDMQGSLSHPEKWRVGFSTVLGETHWWSVSIGQGSCEKCLTQPNPFGILTLIHTVHQLLRKIYIQWCRMWPLQTFDHSPLQIPPVAIAWGCPPLQELDDASNIVVSSHCPQWQVHCWWMCVLEADWAINLGIRKENFWGKLQRIKRKVTWNCKLHWHHRFSVAKSTTHLLLNMIGQWTFSAFFGGETVHRKPHWAPFPSPQPSQTNAIPLRVPTRSHPKQPPSVPGGWNSRCNGGTNQNSTFFWTSHPNPP